MRRREVRMRENRIGEERNTLRTDEIRTGGTLEKRAKKTKK